MTYEEVLALVASDESKTLELKKTTGELKDGMHTACAFLNTDGGYLIFGVAPKSLTSRILIICTWLKLYINLLILKVGVVVSCVLSMRVGQLV